MSIDVLWSIAGWLAWGITIAGSWMVGDKKILGFYLMGFANLILLLDSFFVGYYSLTAASVAFLFLNVMNMCKWMRNPPLDKKKLESASRELLDSVRHIINQEDFKTPRDYGLVPMDKVYAIRDILKPKETP